MIVPWIWTILSAMGIVLTAWSLLDAVRDEKAIRVSRRSHGLEIIALAHIRENTLSLMAMVIVFSLGVFSLFSVSLGIPAVYLILTAFALLVINRVFDRVARRVVMERDDDDRR